MPKISVIVPVYKAEKFLIRCVESLQNQTFNDLEIILVDDGSPDNSPQMCDDFAQMDSRIKVIHKQNGGVSTARNAGLDAATGDYITFVDSDDFLDSIAYEKMMSKAEKYDCDVVLADCIKDFPDHREMYTHEIRKGFYNYERLKAEYYSHLLIMENVEYPATISNWLILAKRELLNDIRYPVGIRFSEDLLVGARIMLKAKSFYYMKDEAYYHYVMNDESATHNFVPDKWDDYVRLWDKINEYFKNSKAYDFSKQIDLCLLFFVYNSVGDIRNADVLSDKEKDEKINSILKSELVREMFKRLKVYKLPISYKLKIVTYFYKFNLDRRILNRI